MVQLEDLPGNTTPRKAVRTKVRTGCITCRIRRVKCDEGKQSCNRCLSTGRVCDGYDLTVRIVNPLGRARQKGLARAAGGLAIPPTLLNGILGTETERNFFYTCRRATEAGVALHICCVTSFWTRLAPQLSHEYEAVRHAVVAVGAAYHLYKVVDIASIPRATKERIEIFILQQYNRSISVLRQDISQKRYVHDTAIVLICCLAYIYLESLRLNHAAAIGHLKNGIQIIESSVDLEALRNYTSARHRHKGKNAILSIQDLWGIVLQFRDCELCMHCFSSEVPMTLGSKLYGKYSAKTTSTQPKAIRDIAEGHEARVQLASEVMSRDWQWQGFKHQPTFWIENHVQQELFSLQQRGRSIDLSLQAYMSSPAAPGKGTWEYYSLCMDMLHTASILAVIELMPVPPEEHAIVAQSSSFQNEILSKMIAYGEEMHAVHTSLGWPPPDVSLETSIVGPMYWVYVYSIHPQNKKRAMKILQETKQREGPWDAKQILMMLKWDSERQCSYQTLRKWGGDANCYEHPK
ncbi:C6 zinc finger domain protein [Trichoderma pleuroticola]